MQSPALIAALAVAALALLNIYVTWRIVRDRLSTRAQKIAQAALVWIVPLVGALVVRYLQRNERFELREYQINPHDPFGGGSP